MKDESEEKQNVYCSVTVQCAHVDSADHKCICSMFCALNVSRLDGSDFQSLGIPF
jgi:hypothetical protein